MSRLFNITSLPEFGDQTSADSVNCDEKGNSCLTLNVNATAIASQGTPQYMEDMVKVKTFNDKKWGNLNLSMVADGHSGDKVSTMLKKNVFGYYQKHFALLDNESMDATLENLDQIMIPVIRNMNFDLQKEIEEKEIPGGSTLVAVFTFVDFQRLYILNVGDSRFMMFESESGNLVHTVSRIVDLEDGLERSFDSKNLQPCCTTLQIIRGTIEVRQKDCNSEIRQRVIRCKDKPGTWSMDFLQHMCMKNDTPDRYGIREWALWLENQETNPKRALQVVGYGQRKDKLLVVGKKGKLNITRAFGDIGLAMHMGEIYVASIPANKEVAFLLCSDGLEESIDCENIRKFLCHPKSSIQNLLPKDNPIRIMSNNHKGFFKSKGIGLYPEGEDVLQKINWIERFLEKMGKSHLPGGEADIPAIQYACSWLKWAHNKYSTMSEENPVNKFQQNFHDSVKFRLQIAIQCALCRFSFDNVSGILVSFKQESNSCN